MVDVVFVPVLLGALVGWLDRQQQEALAYLIEENRILRRQLRGQRQRLTDVDRRRLAGCGFRLGRPGLRWVTTIVMPDTILWWHRQLIARKWTYAKGRCGRPSVLAEIRQLVAWMAAENPTWGYTRIRSDSPTSAARRAFRLAGELIDAEFRHEEDQS